MHGCKVVRAVATNKGSNATRIFNTFSVVHLVSYVEDSYVSMGLRFQVLRGAIYKSVFIGFNVYAEFYWYTIFFAYCTWYVFEVFLKHFFFEVLFLKKIELLPKKNCM